MGLLDFLSKKPQTERIGPDSLIVSAYDATLPSNPPIRGTFPVAGNGSHVLQQFQKLHPHLGTPRYQTPPPIPSASPHNGGERPRTAASTRPDGTRATPTPSIVSNASKKTYGPYRLPPKVATDIRAASGPSKPLPSPGLVSAYSASVRSGESNKARAHVDLLDAQSMFKPSDFHSRVKATGARDYGEDVADRNMGENSSHSQLAIRDRKLEYSSLRSASAISQDIDDDSEERASRRPRGHLSVGSGLRSKYAVASASDSYPKRTSSRLPPEQCTHRDEHGKSMSRTASARSERAARRKSMPSYVGATVGDTSRSSPAGKKGKEKEKDTDSFPDSLRTRARIVASHGRAHAKPNSSHKRQSLTYSHVDQWPRHTRNDSEQTLPDRPESTEVHTRHRAHSALSPSRHSRLPEKRQSLQTIRKANRGEVYEDTFEKRTWPHGAELSREEQSLNSSSKPQLGSTTDLRDPFYNSPAQQPDRQSQMSSSHMRQPSILSISDKSISVRDVESSIPERTSSLRHWSLTSGMSTISSNPFRPQSNHTANTSMLSLGKPDDSIPPVPDIRMVDSSRFAKPRSGSVFTSMQSSTSLYRDPPIPDNAFDNFVMSDGSSPTSSGPRSSYEQDLLFSESGYGVSQLPGLENTFDAAVFQSSASLGTTQDLPHEYSNKTSQFRMPAFVSSESDFSSEHQPEYNWSSSDNEDVILDIPRKRNISVSSSRAARSGTVDENTLRDRNDKIV
ncbi:hypothetical protein F5Y18DRAFT_220846 [Xylariaceae sp. FL1019]|nr:hypothetical protein F5Y18DRAFT_220846 [Xylariaceae sp. FL1019]